MSKHPTNPDQDRPTYEVGYRKPPAKHRFKTGHKGFGPRRKKPVNLYDMLAKALTRTTTVNLDGEPQTMYLIEATLNRLVLQVANNPAKHLKSNLALIQAALAGQEPASDANGVDITAALRLKIERMAENMRLLQSGDEEAKGSPPPKTED